MSSLFEIVPGFIPVQANVSPSGTLSFPYNNGFPMNFFIIIVPRETKWEKITTLSDVLALHGKILDERYY